jgi:hypothetical protein
MIQQPTSAVRSLTGLHRTLVCCAYAWPHNKSIISEPPNEGKSRIAVSHQIKTHAGSSAAVTIGPPKYACRRDAKYLR